jgi:hypothetical protein
VSIPTEVQANEGIERITPWTEGSKQAMKFEHETPSEKDTISITDDNGMTAKLTPEQAYALLEWLTQKKGELAYRIHGEPRERHARGPQDDEW